MRDRLVLCNSGKGVSGPWMSLIIGTIQAISGDVCVNLRSDQMSVAEQFLHASQIGPGIEQMCGVAMAELMRRDLRVQAGDFKVAFQARLDEARIDGCPFFCM